MTDDEMTEQFIKAVRLAKEVNKLYGRPIEKYDTELNQSYIEYPDGRREYAPPIET
jgi:hypothetical protein